MNVLGVLLALAAVANGVLAICTRRISLRLPQSYFKYSEYQARPWWVNGYHFYRRSSRENWVKATTSSCCASLVFLGVVALIVMT